MVFRASVSLGSDRGESGRGTERKSCEPGEGSKTCLMTEFPPQSALSLYPWPLWISSWAVFEQCVCSLA